jgi:hypothetical protein
VAGEKYWEYYDMTSDIFGIANPSAMPDKAIVSLMYVIDCDEELSYIDGDIGAEAEKRENLPLAHDGTGTSPVKKDDQTQDLKNTEPIDLGLSEAEAHEGMFSRSPPSSFDEVERDTGNLA